MQIPSGRLRPSDTMKIYCLFLNIVVVCGSSCIGQPSSLHKAIESNDISAVTEMMATGESPNLELKNGIVPLHIATSRDMVELLLRSGAETENRSKVLKLTPLEFHSRKHWISTIDQKQNEVPKIVVNALIEGGAKYTPTAAVYLGDVHYFEKLIAIDTSWVSSQIADKTLRLAVESGQRSIVWVLLDGGVDPNGKTETDGLPHIFYAVDNVDIARLLLEKGANVRRRKILKLVLMTNSIPGIRMVIIR